MVAVALSYALPKKEAGISSPDLSNMEKGSVAILLLTFALAWPPSAGEDYHPDRTKLLVQ